MLQTKLYIPPLRPNLVPRPHLIERLNQGLQQGCKLTLVSAPAGFGKTTLVSEWVSSLRLDTDNESKITTRIAWLSLDERDNDPARFLAYLVAALNQIEGIETAIGKGALGMLQSPQAPPAVREIVFTCPGCYGDLIDMIETYRQGLEEADENPVSIERAVSAWYEEIYGPGIEIIQKNNLLARFSNRTKADLFIWTWKNNKVLEELVLEDENPPSGD